MDSGKGKREEKVEQTMDYAALREHVQSVGLKTLAAIDEKINSRWVRGDKKGYLKLFRTLLASDMSTTMLLYSLCESIESQLAIDVTFGQILDQISRQVERLKGTTKEIENLKSKIDDIMNSPAVQELMKAIQNMKNAAEKLDQNRRQIVRDSIV